MRDDVQHQLRKAALNNHLRPQISERLGQASVQLGRIAGHGTPAGERRRADCRLLSHRIRQFHRHAQHRGDAGRLQPVLLHRSERSSAAGERQRPADLRAVRRQPGQVRPGHEHGDAGIELRQGERVLQRRRREPRRPASARHQHLGRLEHRQLDQPALDVARRDHLEVEPVRPRQLAAGSEVPSRERRRDRLRIGESVPESGEGQRLGPAALEPAGRRGLSEHSRT